MVKIEHRLVQRPGMALLMLICMMVFMASILGFVMGLLGNVIEDARVVTRLASIFQGVFVFILPAILTAVLSTKLPAKLLCLQGKPSWVALVAVVAIMLASMTAMEWIVDWNQNIKLPQSMESIERLISSLESAVGDTVHLMLGEPTAGNIIVSILIVGVLAGFSEELFFRGAMQRLFAQTGLGPHGAIWLTAFIFSAIHMQFYGFVPRFLLGAYFGYLLYWSDSLWVPITAHILNNVAAVSMYYITGNEMTGVETSWYSVLSSALFTGVLLVAFKRYCKRRDTATEQ